MIRPQIVHITDFAENNEISLSLFATEIGWMGILGRDQVVMSIVIGHTSALSATKAARKSISDRGFIDGVSIKEQDWLPELRKSLHAYASGQPVEFGAIDLQFPPQTKFREKVLKATLALRYGETTSYGELARRVGHPGAARAVGTVMSTNRFPILIPCHRVLAAGGKLGGYTSPSGTRLKQRLLDMEQSR